MDEFLGNLPVTWLDLVVMAVLVLSGLLAYVRGFVREILSIGAWVGAAAITYFAYPHALPYALQLTDIELVARLGTMSVVFVVILVLLTLISSYLASGVKDSAIGPLDRALGFLFGLARGAFLVCLGFILLVFFLTDEHLPEPVLEARSLPLVAVGSDLLLAAIPAEETRDLRDAIARVRDGVSLAIDAEEAYRRLTQPEPVAPADGREKAPSYAEHERRNMESLIEQAE